MKPTLIVRDLGTISDDDLKSYRSLAMRDFFVCDVCYCHYNECDGDRNVGTDLCPKCWQAVCDEWESQRHDDPEP